MQTLKESSNIMENFKQFLLTRRQNVCVAESGLLDILIIIHKLDVGMLFTYFLPTQSAEALLEYLISQFPFFFYKHIM